VGFISYKAKEVVREGSALKDKGKGERPSERRNINKLIRAKKAQSKAQRGRERLAREESTWTRGTGTGKHWN